MAFPMVSGGFPSHAIFLGAPHRRAPLRGGQIRRLAGFLDGRVGRQVPKKRTIDDELIVVNSDLYVVNSDLYVIYM